MRNELLSIGEVSKMKNVGVKSLRYYERLGILPPAFVDPQSGYRYYSMNQMVDIDVITTCISLGIPLKELTDYLHPHSVLDIEPLLERGRGIAVQRLRAAQAALLQIDEGLEQIKVQNELKREAGPYCRELDEKLALMLPWEGEAFDAKRYVAAITSLYGQLDGLGLVPLFVQGMARFPNGAHAGWNVVVEVCEGEALCGAGGYAGSAKPRKGERLADCSVFENGAVLGVIPGGMFTGSRIVEDGFTGCFETACAQVGEARVTLALEVWDAETHVESYVVELLERD